MRWRSMVTEPPYNYCSELDRESESGAMQAFLAYDVHYSEKYRWPPSGRLAVSPCIHEFIDGKWIDFHTRQEMSPLVVYWIPTIDVIDALREAFPGMKLL